MNSASPLPLSPRPLETMPAGESLPGRDAGRDRARHYAAVGVFGLAALSALSVAVAAYVLRPGEPDTLPSLPFALQEGGFPAMGVAADMPALRPSLGAEEGASITVFDGATGRREVLAGPAAQGGTVTAAGESALTP